MKRFYCTVCQRVKRVRTLPKNVAQVNSELPTLRQGECKWHNLRMLDSATPSRAQFNRAQMVGHSGIVSKKGGR